MSQLLGTLYGEDGALSEADKLELITNQLRVLSGDNTEQKVTLLAKALVDCLGDGEMLSISTRLPNGARRALHFYQPDEALSPGRSLSGRHP